MQDKTLLCIAGIFCITLLEGAAVVTHQDGQLFLACIAGIGALAGVAGIGTIKNS